MRCYYDKKSLSTKREENVTRQFTELEENVNGNGIRNMQNTTSL